MFTVVTVDDLSDENSSMVTVEVVEVALASGGSAPGMVEAHPSDSSVAFMVLDNDAEPVISFTRPTFIGEEFNEEVVFTVELLSSSTNSAGRRVSSEKEIMFAFSTGVDTNAGADGRAIADVDYVSVTNQNDYDSRKYKKGDLHRNDHSRY